MKVSFLVACWAIALGLCTSSSAQAQGFSWAEVTFPGETITSVVAGQKLELQDEKITFVEPYENGRRIHVFFATSSTPEYSRLGVRRHYPGEVREKGELQPGRLVDGVWSWKVVTPSGDWWPRWIEVGNDIQPVWVQIKQGNTLSPKPDPEFSLSIPPAPVPPVPEAK